MAHMIKDAIATADNHLKVAQENLVKAQTLLEILNGGKNPVPRPLPKTNHIQFLRICLALFISLIVLAQFLRRYKLGVYKNLKEVPVGRRNFDVTSGSLISKCQQMENCLRFAFANLKSIIPTLITHGDQTSARFLQWKTIALCSMFLVVSVSAVYLIMVTPVFGLTGVWTGLIIFMSLIGTAGLLRLPVITAHQQPSELIKTDQSNKATRSAEAAPSELMKPDTNDKETTSEGGVLQQPSELIKPDPNNNETTSVGAVPKQPSELIISDQNNQDTTSPGALLQQPSEMIKPDPNNNETTSVGTVLQQPSELIISDLNKQETLSLDSAHQQPSEITKESMKTEIKDSIQGLQSLKERFELTKLDKINKNEVDEIKYAIKAVRLIEEYLTSLKSQNNNYGEHEKKIQDALKPAIDAVESMEKIINNGV